MSEARREWRWLLLVFCLALAMRLWTLAVSADAPYYLLMSLEAAESARNILAGKGYVTDGSTGNLAVLQVEQNRLIDIEGVVFPPGNRALDPTTRRYNLDGEPLPTFTRPWGFPLVLAAGFALGGAERYLPVQVFQALLDAACAALVLLLGSLLLPRRAARLSALFYALFPPFAFLATRALWDAYALPLTICALYFSVRAAQSGSDRKLVGWALLAGVFTGLGYWFRFEFLVAPIFLVMALLPVLSLRRLMLAGAAITAAMLIFVAPWALRNHSLSGQFLLTGTSAYVLLEGLGELPDNPWGIECSDKAMNLEAVRMGYPNAFTPEANEHFRKRYREALAQDPGAALRAVLHRVPLSLTSSGFEILGPQFLRKTIDAKLMYYVTILLATVVLVLGFSAWIWLFVRHRRVFLATFVFWVPAVLAISTHLLTHWEARYTTVSYLSYAWFAALAIHRILARLGVGAPDEGFPDPTTRGET